MSEVHRHSATATMALMALFVLWKDNTTPGKLLVAGISKDDGLITLQDAEGNTRLISPREAVAEGVTLYTPDTIRVGTGDRMRFTKSDRERGYVANSVWTVTAVSGDSVTLSGGQQTW